MKYANEQEQVIKYLNVLTALKGAIHRTDGRINLHEFFKKHHVCAKEFIHALKGLNIIKNYGTSYFPKIKWLQGEPVPLMVRLLIEEIRRNRKPSGAQSIQSTPTSNAVTINSYAHLNRTPEVLETNVKAPRKRIKRKGVIRRIIEWLW